MHCLDFILILLNTQERGPVADCGAINMKTFMRLRKKRGKDACLRKEFFFVLINIGGMYELPVIRLLCLISHYQ